MRIVCPSCQAAYEVPDKLLSGPAKRVRCARCGEQWLPQAEAPVAGAPPPLLPTAAEPELEPEPEPPVVPPAVRPLPAAPPVASVAARVEERLAPEPPPAAGRGGVVVAGLAWLASLALLGGAGWAMVTWRAEVMAAWAASRRLYQWLGLA